MPAPLRLSLSGVSNAMRAIGGIIMDKDNVAACVFSSQEIQGECTSCNLKFAIPVMELKDYNPCPNCGNDANITVFCPHCGEGITTGGSTISCLVPCPVCNKDFIWNTVKSTDGTPMVVSMTGRLELHDLASIINIMQENLEKTESPDQPKINNSNSHSNTKNKAAEPKGCLCSLVAMISLCASLMAFIFILLQK